MGSITLLSKLMGSAEPIEPMPTGPMYHHMLRMLEAMYLRYFILLLFGQFKTTHPDRVRFRVDL